MERVKLQDTQNQRDPRGIAIDRVGVRELRYPMQVRDKSHNLQHTVATATLTVDLPHQFKGTHMSRFVETLNAFGPELHVQNVPDLLHSLCERLHSKRSHVTFEFPYFLRKLAPVSRAPGMMDYNVCFDATLIRGRVDFILTVRIPVTTLCPCSKAISERGAHNQRGIVSLAVRFKKPVWIEDIIAIAEASASSELFSLLKRTDEKAVTERAYDHPVFVEDLVRNIATRCQAHRDITWYRVEADNFESIHNHNAYACIERKKRA